MDSPSFKLLSLRVVSDFILPLGYLLIFLFLLLAQDTNTIKLKIIMFFIMLNYLVLYKSNRPTVF